jgi:hypothetical protein
MNNLKQKWQDIRENYLLNHANIFLQFIVCLMRNQNLDTKGSFFVNCPCKAPLTCIVDGGHDMPLGPTGNYKK